MSSKRSERPAWHLPLLMLVGASGGLALGSLLGDRWSDPAWEAVPLASRALGAVFLSVLKAIAIPLIVTSVTLAVTRVGRERRLGRTLGVALGYFVTTTLFAVITGIVLVELIAPGSGAAGMVGHAGAAAAPASSPPTAAAAAYGVVTGMFPENVVHAAAAGNVLGLVVYSLVFGAVLARMGERVAPLVAVLDALDATLMRLVRAVVWAAPLGIFGLVADRIGKAGGGAVVGAELARLAGYAGTVVAGLAIHAFVTLPLLLRLVGRRRPLRYAARMSEALVTALGTASSAATMGVTLRCVIEKNRVSQRSADLVIPLGTTINMDGTALYEAVAVIFIAQVSGHHLTLAQHVVVAITATLAAVGAAAIPEAGLVTMVLVMQAVGLPPEGVGLILSIDWILDRIRTSVNVWGDAVGAAVVDRALPPAHEPAGESSAEPAGRASAAGESVEEAGEEG